MGGDAGALTDSNDLANVIFFVVLTSGSNT